MKGTHLSILLVPRDRAPIPLAVDAREEEQQAGEDLQDQLLVYRLTEWSLTIERV